MRYGKVVAWFLDKFFDKFCIRFLSNKNPLATTTKGFLPTYFN